MKLIRNPLLIAFLALGACQVRLPIEEARAGGVELEQVRADAPAGTPVQARGPWTELNLKISRATMSKIALWQIYFTVHVIDCRTGALRDVARTKVNGIDPTNFKELRRVMRLSQGQQDYWLVAYILHSPPGSCAKLEGGSYALQKVSSDSAPIKIE
jgi:hypothetical protein